ncbi:MAG: N-6 DNA methylase [Ardenticatenales bacterium]|nr:N-6 DNA methylase [Ardenticatenales bacterium]
MTSPARSTFPTVRTEGALLPADLLSRVAAAQGMDGMATADYHLAPNERLNEITSRAWNRCLGAWTAFAEVRDRLGASERGTTETRERWLLILFQELGYGRLTPARAVDVDGTSYAVSHRWGHVPIHLVSFRQEIDKRGTGTGAAARSPHGLVQELLNRDKDSQWGIVSNGLRLRLLRDNVSLSRQAYVEFDLEAMLSGEQYADFALLWLVCHQSRVEAEDSAPCWLERWHQTAAEQGVRALEVLRGGVEAAITALGRGFLRHRDNGALKESLRSGDLGTQEFYRQLLRLVYRLIFLFVAEDRDLLLLPDTPAAVRERYLTNYGARRLRTLAGQTRGGPHSDLFQVLTLVAEQLRAGYEPLGLPALGGYLFSDRSTPDLDGAALGNRDLLSAIYVLTYKQEGAVRRGVDFRNLGAEELGSVYESLLELHPRVDVAGGVFELQSVAGSERKTSGSYYTPSSLIQCLLDSALEPVVADRLEAAAREGRSAEEVVLDIKVVDPACGSGHFLIAAAHRLARHLARVRSGEVEPPPSEMRAALRDVVRRCIHGVDINEMAVELCKVALWMETLDPGKPLSFLDANIRCGNSLLGTTPRLLAAGIPDAAFVAIEGDDKGLVSELKKRNKQERAGQMRLFSNDDYVPWEHLGNLATAMVRLESSREDSLADVQARQQRYEDLVRSDDYRSNVLLADAWCAAFVWPKVQGSAAAITETVFRALERNPNGAVSPGVLEEIGQLRERYRFFHWHLVFPHVFRVPGRGEVAENEGAGWSGGFDVVLGNPPWERVKIQEKEWFVVRHPAIAAAPNADARRRMIALLATEDPPLHAAFLADRRQADGESHLIRTSANFPLCGVGDVNTYSVFAELAITIQGPYGRAGIIVPSAIATDHTTRHFFGNLIERHRISSLYEFENEGFFRGIGSGHMNRFCLLTVVGSLLANEIGDFFFQGKHITELSDSQRHFELTSTEIKLLNPNTGTCPIFRTRHDAGLTISVYSRVPVLNAHDSSRSSPWGVSYFSMLHMANDSERFRTLQQLESDGWHLDGSVFRRGRDTYLPLYEAKMVSQFDHRFGDFSLLNGQQRSHVLPDVPDTLKANPSYTTLPFYWIPSKDVEARLADSWSRDWLLGWRDVTDARASARTVLACVIPRAGVGHTVPLVFSANSSAAQIAALSANLASFVLDYLARQKVGGTHLTFSILNQLPFIPPDNYGAQSPWKPSATLLDWILSRVLELTYTAWELQPFARDCGYGGPPFRWDVERRFILRCELDAAYFHLYGIEREDAAYIMDTFPVVRRKDVATYSEYRTQLVILEEYDRMAEAMAGGPAYISSLNPVTSIPSDSGPV